MTRLDDAMHNQTLIKETLKKLLAENEQLQICRMGIAIQYSDIGRKDEIIDLGFDAGAVASVAERVFKEESKAAEQKLELLRKQHSIS